MERDSAGEAPLSSPEVAQPDHGHAGDAGQHAPEPAEIERFMPEHPRQNPDDQRADGVKEAHVRVGPEAGRVEEETLVDRHAKGGDQSQPAGVLAEQRHRAPRSERKGIRHSPAKPNRSSGRIPTGSSLTATMANGEVVDPRRPSARGR